MKKLIIIFAVLSISFISACDKGFDEMNINPNYPTSTDPQYLFNFVVKEAGGQHALADINHRFLFKWIMQSETPYGNSTYPPYTTMTATNIKTMWERFYTVALLNTNELIVATSKDEKDINKNAIARIMRVYIFHLITDLWGDVPYSEAVKAYSDRTLKPKYDTQEAIYADMLLQLKEAVDDFDPEKVSYTTDMLFKGDLNKWKKFANSLRLRLAIRSSNQQIVTELMQNQASLISSNDESAMFKYATNTDDWSPFYGIYYVKPDNPTSLGKISMLLVDTMKYMSDPRVPIYAWPVTVNGAQQYNGIPNLLKVDEVQAMKVSSTTTSYHGLRFVSKPDTENPLITYSEVCFLKAEAAINGWGANASEAATFYNEGIRANMQWLDIADTEIDTYLAGKAKYNAAAADPLEQVITQKWISLYLNGFETFAEYRRTGYPQLRKPKITLGFNPPSTRPVVLSWYWIDIDDDEIQFPQRLTYSEDEIDLNSENYSKALEQQGADELGTKIWWIKKFEQRNKK